MSRIVIHVGYPKCGSTSIQKHLFATHPAINDLTPASRMDLSEIASEPSLGRMSTCLVALASSDDRIVATARETWRTMLQSKLLPGRTSVLSSEDVLVRPEVSGTPPATFFARIAECVPDANILFFIRPQHEIIRSRYDMYPVIEYADRTSHRSVPLAAYVDYVLKGDPTFSNGMMFARRIEEAQHHFGAECVHVFTFHEIFNTGTGVARLAHLLGVEEAAIRAAVARPAVNDFAMHATRRRMRRLLGPIHGSWLLPRKTLVAINTRIGRAMKVKRTEMPAGIAARIEAFYAEDNARLNQIVPELGTF